MNIKHRRASTTEHPPLVATRLLDQLRERIRYLHYSLRTAQAYVHWTKTFIRFHRMRHPRDMGGAEVEAFLSHMTTYGNVSVSNPGRPPAAQVFARERRARRAWPYVACNGRAPWCDGVGKMP